MPDLVFPDGFLWGAATSAHQVEGDNVTSDWWAAEQRGDVPYRSGKAADSWNRWSDDVDLAASLGLGAYRISCEWARVEPQPGVFDREVLARYAEQLAAARARGMRTMLVLWHFTNPAWLGELGGWEGTQAPARFERYAREVAGALGPHVDLWATLNEPNTFAWLSYIRGDWPPHGKRAWPRGWRAMARLAEAHRLGYAAIKQTLGDAAQVGMTMLMLWYHPAAKGGGLSGPAIAGWRWAGNWRVPDLAGDTLDWIGVQYYYDTPMRTWWSFHDEPGTPRTDLGWRIAPEGLYQVLRETWQRYRRPLYVTENGLADSRDAQRGRFIIDHLGWVHRAIREGAVVRGYLHWSLIDNFEWALGFDPRFGLAEVDYTTFARTPRPSAALYSDIVAANAIPAGLGDDLRYADGTGPLGPPAVR